MTRVATGGARTTENFVATGGAQRNDAEKANVIKNNHIPYVIRWHLSFVDGDVNDYRQMVVSCKKRTHWIGQMGETVDQSSFKIPPKLERRS